MTLTSPRKALQLRMWALFMFFFIPGLLMASWATRTPAIRDILSVSTAEMGIVLFGLSIGSMSGILCSAWLVKRFGTRAVIRTTMCFAVFGMMVLSAALWFASPVLFALGLTVFGGSFGSAEVAINVEGAAVEREMNKTVLPMMHGFYSLGTLAGAGVGMALTATGVSANLHILLAALVCNRLNSLLGGAIRPKLLFQHPGFADFCEQVRVTPHNLNAQPPLTPSGRTEAPCRNRIIRYGS